MKTRVARFVSGLFLLAAPSFVGCTPTYSDPYYDNRYGDSRSRSVAYDDEAYCRRVADDVSGDTVTEVGKGAIVGGAVGAAAGAAAGAIAGDAGKGAAIGAATGGVGGAVVQGTRKNQRYNDVYASCMRERGYSVY
jgi:outer membrane lipoprotein SlyB